MCNSAPNIPPEYVDIPLDEVPMEDGLRRKLRKMRLVQLGDLNRIDLRNPGRGWSQGPHLRGLGVLIEQARSGTFAPQPDPQSGNTVALLLSCIDLALAGMRADDVALLERRIGTGTVPPMTLEQLARELGVTRERIRQRQESIIDRIRGTGGPSFAVAARSVASRCTRNGLYVIPMLVDRLFSSRQETPRRSGRFYAALLSILFPELPVWIHLPRSRGTPAGLERRIRDKLDEVLNARDGEVPVHIGYFGVQAIVPDATPVAFRDAVIDSPRYEVVGEGTRQWAIRRVTRMLGKDGAMRVLERSDTPLTATEINQRGREQFRDLWRGNVDRALDETLLKDHRDVFLLGPHRFGLARHIGLSQEQRTELANRFHQAITETGRPMTTSEFVRQHNLDLFGANAYILAAIADMDNRFFRAGRKFTFDVRPRTAPTPPVWGPMLRDVAIAVLHEAGRPLAVGEITELIRRHRPCSKNALSPILTRLRRAGTVVRTADHQYALASEPTYRPVAIENPYSRPGYRRIFQRLVAGPPATKAELIEFAVTQMGKTRTAAKSSVDVVLSPKEGGRNPRGSQSAKGHMFYVTKDAQGRWHAHPRATPLEPFRRRRTGTESSS